PARARWLRASMSSITGSKRIRVGPTRPCTNAWNMNVSLGQLENPTPRDSMTARRRDRSRSAPRVPSTTGGRDVFGAGSAEDRCALLAAALEQGHDRTAECRERALEIPPCGSSIPDAIADAPKLRPGDPEVGADVPDRSLLHRLHLGPRPRRQLARTRIRP